MVPSPRKRVPRAPFNQTWDESDAAFLDPTSLPVARIPRGWERKQETKKTDQGKEKKIWRRFNLRSRAASVSEETSEEEHDARSRAVKKQQHMSPQAMEKTVSKSNGKTRAFKATRWDRRKSVLPRKKAARSESLPVGKQDMNEEGDETQDATLESASDESFAAVDSILDSHMDPEQILLPVEERRATFTFTMDTEANVDLPDYESLNGLDDQEPEVTMQTEDTTLAQLFQSPRKETTTTSPKGIQYPKLPCSDNAQVEPETTSDFTIAEEPTTILEINGCVSGVTDAGIDVEEKEIKGQENSHHDTVSRDVDTIVDSTADIPPVEVYQTNEVAYPTLPSDVSPSESRSPQASSPVKSHVEPENQDMVMSDVTTLADEKHENLDEADDIEPSIHDDIIIEEDITEASLQLSIQRDYEETTGNEQSIVEEAPEETIQQNTLTGQNPPQDAIRQVRDVEFIDGEQLESPPEAPIVDIADGLTLSFTPAKAPSIEPTPRKLHSPPPPVQSSLDDATMTIALDDDTALLKDFLNRAAASKAEKAAVLTHRRESLQNRRDSDVIRHALASPRKALEEKDPNSPSKHDNELTLDLSQTLTLNMDSNALSSPVANQPEDGEATEEKSSRGSRRSSRAKKSRLPAPASATQAQTSKIAIRRTDGNEHVVLKKSDAQELATLTRTNTRKNKQGAFCVTVRLMKIAFDAANLPPVDDSTKELVVGKNIRWDEQLTYYQENPETVAERESLATPDELSMPDAASTPSAKPKSKISKNSTPKMRRVRGLGTANGTPGKGLLAPAPLLPDSIAQDKDAAATPAQQLPRPKASKLKKMPVATISGSTMSTPSDTKLPSLDIVPVGVQPTKERKSRLAAPKKVMLPPSVAAVPVEGKENTQRTGIGAATPKKGIPAPKVIVPPTVGVESGLPRRRGRRV